MQQPRQRIESVRLVGSNVITRFDFTTRKWQISNEKLPTDAKAIEFPMEMSAKKFLGEFSNRNSFKKISDKNY